MLPLSSGSVVYQCHCSGPEFNECNESSGPLFPLPSLLFCTSTTCKAAIKCGRCTTAEFASFFCANCLFEMPSASVKAERNRCARNCFECPTCLNTLTVVSALDGGAVHYLACGVCRWESVEVGIKFDRPTGLAMQMQKADEDRQDVQEFANLKSFFDKKSRASTAPAGASMADLFRSSSISLPPSLLANIPALASLNSLGKGSLPTEADVDTKYEAKFKGNQADDDQEVERMRKLKIEETTTLNQRLNQVEDQPRIVSAVRPQRILLRTKRAKRCKDCDHVLVKPEQKAQSSKFTIQLPAIDYIPRVTIAHPLPSLPLQPGTNVTLNLRVTNPQSTALRVMIAPQIKNDEEYSLGYSITVLAPTFTLKAHDEVNEFEEDKSKHELEAGVVKKSHNWAIIPVSLQVNRMKRDVLQFPLLVRYTTIGEDGNDTGEPVSYWIVVAL